MPLVTSYDTAGLEAYIETELESVAESLGMLENDAVPATARAVTRLLGHADISEATDMLKVETVASWLAWRRAKAAAVGKIDLKAGSAQLWQSQVFDHIVAMLADAEAAASQYEEVQAALAGAGGMAYVSSIGAQPPYGYVDEWA